MKGSTQNNHECTNAAANWRQHVKFLVIITSRRTEKAHSNVQFHQKHPNWHTPNKRIALIEEGYVINSYTMGCTHVHGDNPQALTWYNYFIPPTSV